MVKEASIDHPFEEDACRCHFNLDNMSGDSELVLKYQWYIGDKTPTNFVAIDGAVGEVLHSSSSELKSWFLIACVEILCGLLMTRYTGQDMKMLANS